MLQNGGGHAYDSNPSMCDRGGKRNHVQYGTATDDGDEGLPVEADLIDLLEHSEEGSGIVLRRFAAGDDDRRADELEGIREGGEVGLDI